MATATQRNPSASSRPGPRAEGAPRPSARGWFVNLVDAIYRFLASLKLAVITLGLLAGTLGYATFFESWYGTAAVREYIYRTPGFAILLAFLGTNILCAALIRIPWKKRQTGFVITHAGLLVILAGSYYSVHTADEGQMGMLEGDVRGELVRTDYPVLRVWEVDPHTREYTREFDLPFHPGAFAWGAGRPRPVGLTGRAASLATLGLAGPSGETEELLSKPGDPFQLVVKEHLPSSAPAVEHVAADDGTPMARIRVLFKGPGMPREQDAFPSEDQQWFATEPKFARVVRAPMRGAPAQITFASADKPELVEDFLKPPLGGGKDGVARFRYTDRAGHARVFDWALEGQVGKSVDLPESDLKATLTKIVPLDPRRFGFDEVLGDDPVPIAQFDVRRGAAPAVGHMAMANLPAFPNVIPSADGGEAKPRTPLVAIHYMIAPEIDPKTNGRFGQIDVLAGPDGSLSYRVFGRGKDGHAELRGAGAAALGRPIVAFGDAPGMPMTMRFVVEDYLPRGATRDIFVPFELPKGKMDEGTGACRVAMTVGGQTKDVWLQRSISLDPPAPKMVAFGEAVYALAYDCDRKPLGFKLKLDDFDIGFEPGTEQPTRFVSKVTLNDEAQGVKDRPYTISMNEPLYHRGYTFYQSRYVPDIDPRTNRRTGRFQSIFQVAINPGRPIIYLGCLMVIMGTFVQFYMRAGIFTDGGKRERERAALKARAKARKLAEQAGQPMPADQPDHAEPTTHSDPEL